MIIKNTVILLLILSFSIISNRTYSQTDTLKLDKVTPVLIYIGSGGGINTRGANLDLSLTCTSKGYWGGSLNYRLGSINLQNVPDDYYEGFLRWATPADEFSSLSLHFVKKFSTRTGFFRFGFEAGPSLVRYDLIELELNPDWPGLFEYKYNNIHTLKNTTGLSILMKADFPFTRVIGCELSLFGIMNKVKSVVGLDFCLNLGIVRKK